MDFVRSESNGHDHEPIHALTTKQRAIVDAIDNYERATGEWPAASYLARRFDVDWSTIRGHLVALHRKGWLTTPNPPLSLKRRPCD